MKQPSTTRAVLLAVLLCALSTSACGGRRTPKPRPAKKLDKDVKKQPLGTRDLWQQPDVIVDKMALGPAMFVIDLGAGEGYMTPWLAAAVGGEGKVWAVEIDPALVKLLNKKVADNKLTNVQVVQSTINDLPVAALVDRILLLNTYPELADPVGMLKALRLRLRPGGRLVVVDYKPNPKVPGPPAEDRLSLQTIEAEARGAGLALAFSYDVLPRQYIAVFVPAEEVHAAKPGVNLPDRPTKTQATP